MFLVIFPTVCFTSLVDKSYVSLGVLSGRIKWAG